MMSIQVTEWRLARQGIGKLLGKNRARQRHATAREVMLLAPTLASGDIVIADNLSSHKVVGVRQAIEARGAALLLLPSYSPDLNPIEQVFAKLKQMPGLNILRSVALLPSEALWQKEGQVRLQLRQCVIDHMDGGQSDLARPSA